MNLASRMGLGPRVLDLAAAPGDGDEVRLTKRVVVAICLAAAVVGAFHALALLATDLGGSALLPLVASCVFTVCLVWLRLSRRVGLVREVLLGLLLVLPMVGHLLNGGFAGFRGDLLWATLLPLLALLSGTRLRSRVWLGAYVILLAAAVALEPLVGAGSGLQTAHTIPLASTLAFLTVGLHVILRTVVRDRDAARARSEALLANVLPEPIAARLKAGQLVIADEVDEASVLFADLVGFTPLSAVLSPDACVEMLNALFSRFDALADELGVEKIRTMGDGYMVGAGLTMARVDHAQVLADLGLAMIEVVKQHPPVEGVQLALRVGVNTGPLIAGVIGTSRLQYDVWGDVVNTASRMESHGVPGRLQVTAATRDKLKGEFLLGARGLTSVKGKGEMETWFVLRRREDDSSPQGE